MTIQSQRSLTFSIISGICFFILITVLVRYFYGLYSNEKNAKPTALIDPLVSRFATISLLGYTIFVFLSFALDIIASLWYIESIDINYTKIICQFQTFNICFFMIGKLAMYFFFMMLVHISFYRSSFAYSPKLLASLAVSFFLIMCTIGALYMLFLFEDFQSIESITSPSDCLEFNISNRTAIVIWTGSICDAIWSFTCLLLFCCRLRTLVHIMEEQQIKSKRNVFEPKRNGSKSNNDHNSPMSQTDTNHDPSATHTLSHDHSSRKTSGSVLESMHSIKLKMTKKKRRKKKKPSPVHQFLPVMLKLTILCTWSAVSTAALGFSLWTIYPTLSSVIDSTINAICVYLSFGFAEKEYTVLCLPFISFKHCIECMEVIKEVRQLEKAHIYDKSELSVLG